MARLGIAARVLAALAAAGKQPLAASDAAVKYADALLQVCPYPSCPLVPEAMPDDQAPVERLPFGERINRVLELMDRYGVTVDEIITAQAGPPWDSMHPDGI